MAPTSLNAQPGPQFVHGKPDLPVVERVFR